MSQGFKVRHRLIIILIIIYVLHYQLYDHATGQHIRNILCCRSVPNCRELRGTQSTDKTALDWTTQHPVSDTTYPVSDGTYPESDIESPVWQKTTGRDRHVTKV